MGEARVSGAFIRLFLMIVASLNTSCYVSSPEVSSSLGVSGVSSAGSSAGYIGSLKVSTSGTLHPRYGLLVAVSYFSSPVVSFFV